MLATERTLASRSFRALEARLSAATGVRFLAQACTGLADQVEKGELRSPATAALVRRYVEPLICEGADTLVLGCTHYPFLLPLIEETARCAAGRDITVVDTGAAVARQLQRVLTERGMLRVADACSASISAWTTRSATDLSRAFTNLLQLNVVVTAVGRFVGRRGWL